mmetsp:Transcript_31843/g.77603  ORF Transcript_31843/g.77603 Transcript_31843/m.77603 type:complete len:80 (-) Transcript_31843:106-345(-)
MTQFRRLTQWLWTPTGFAFLMTGTFGGGHLIREFVETETRRKNLKEAWIQAKVEHLEEEGNGTKAAGNANRKQVRTGSR